VVDDIYDAQHNLCLDDMQEDQIQEVMQDMEKSLRLVSNQAKFAAKQQNSGLDYISLEVVDGAISAGQSANVSGSPFEETLEPDAFSLDVDMLRQHYAEFVVEPILTVRWQIVCGKVDTNFSMITYTKLSNQTQDTQWECPFCKKFPNRKSTSFVKMSNFCKHM
jgi:hypothetical protein